MVICLVWKRKRIIYTNPEMLFENISENITMNKAFGFVFENWSFFGSTVGMCLCRPSRSRRLIRREIFDFPNIPEQVLTRNLVAFNGLR